MSDAVTVDEVDSGVTQGDEPVRVDFTAAVRVSSPLRLDQFTAELAARVSLPVQSLVLSCNGDPSIASAEQPVVIWTAAQEVSPNALLAAAQQHDPDPAWSPSVPAGGVTRQALEDKAAAGVALSYEELQLAVRFLLTG